MKADDGWTVHSNMRGKGSSGNGNKSGTNSPVVGMLGKVGTPVAATKPLLTVHTWKAALMPNPSASVFSALNKVRRANLQDYQGQEEFILTNFGGNHRYCVWLTSTVQMALVRAIHLLELAGLDSQVVVTNVISVTPHNKGDKDKGKKLKYLMQFTPRVLAEDPSQCASMAAYPEKIMALLHSRLQQVIKSEQVSLP